MKEELLGNLKYNLAEDTDINITVELKKNYGMLKESTYAYNLDVAERSETERLRSQKFRFYGQIEYKSILDGITKSPVNTSTNDIDEIMSIDEDVNPRTLLNSFDIYLCIKDSTLSPTPVKNSDGVLPDGYYKQNFKIVSKLDDCILQNAGYYVTEDGENIMYFNFNSLYNAEGLKDYFNKPISSYYLYFRYKRYNTETLYEKNFLTPYSSGTFNYVQLTGTTALSGGTVLNGDIISFKKEDYIEETFREQNYKINVPCTIKNNSTFQFYTDLLSLLNGISKVYPSLVMTLEELTFYDPVSAPNGHELKVRFSSNINVSNGTTLPSVANYTEVISSLYSSLFRKIYVKTATAFGKTIYTFLFRNINYVNYDFNLELKYDPFRKIPIRNWSEYTENGTPKTDIIPDHALKIDADNYIWKDYGLYKDFPFVNDSHYVYTTIYFTVVPDLSNVNSITYKIFKNFNYNAKFLLSNYNTNNIKLPNEC